MKRLAYEFALFLGTIPFLFVVVASVGLLYIHSNYRPSAIELYLTAIVGRCGWGLAYSAARYRAKELDLDVPRLPISLLLYSLSVPVYFGAVVLVRLIDPNGDVLATPILVVGGRISEIVYARSERWTRYGQYVRSLLLISSASLWGFECARCAV